MDGIRQNNLPRGDQRAAKSYDGDVSEVSLQGQRICISHNNMGSVPARPGLSLERSYRPGRPECRAIWGRHGLWTELHRPESW
jgi:hypothetical protein